MKLKLFKRIYLYFYPPKPGDIFISDSINFVSRNAIEKVLHGMTDKFGDTVWHVATGEGTYRLTVDSDTMPYYRATAEVLATDNSNKFQWLKRSQPRRIYKDKFKDMIVHGRLKKNDSNK